MNIPALTDHQEILSDEPDPLELLIALEEEAIALGIDPNYYTTEKLK